MENHGSRSGGSPARGKMPVRLSTSQRRLRPKRDDMSRTSTQHPPFTGRGQGNHGREHAARTRRLFIGCDASARPQLSGLGGARDGDPRSCCPGRRRGRPAFREGLTARALTCHRGSRWPRWLRGRAGDRSEALRLLTQCVSTFTPAPRPPFLGDDVTPPPVTRAAFVHRVCSALHKDPGLMM